jgi:hypothetical protein
VALSGATPTRFFGIPHRGEITLTTRGCIQTETLKLSRDMVKIYHKNALGLGIQMPSIDSRIETGARAWVF